MINIYTSSNLPIIPQTKNPTNVGLDDSIIILFYLEQQHSTLQQAQSQLQLQGFPFSHPLQEHSPLQHLHFLSQHDLFLLFIIFSKKYLTKSTHHPKNKKPHECGA